MRPRQGHSAVLRAQLARGRLRWLARAARQVLRLRFGQPPRAPLFATLAVTYRCNYRCEMCDLPQRAGRDPDLRTLRQRIDTLAARGALALGITGGEPLLHPDLSAIIEHAHARGMLVHLNTNGSRLTAQRAAALAAAPLHSINISLDGARAGTHDPLRGVPGSFAEIEASVRALLAARRGSQPRVGLVMAVSRENFDEIPEFVARARILGVDTAGFLPHHDFVRHPQPFGPGEMQRLQQLAHRVAASVDNSPAYLQLVPAFLGGAKMPTTCSAPTSHLAVDPEGMSYPCVPFMTLRKGGVSLQEATEPVAFEVDEETCQRCWWNCHREQDLSIGLLRPARDASSSPSPSSASSPTSAAWAGASSMTTSASSARTPGSRR